MMLVFVGLICGGSRVPTGNTF